MHKVIIKYIFIFTGLLFSASCALFRPLPLEPFANPDTVQGIEKSSFSKFNCDYEIISVDSNFCTLNYALVYSELLNSKKQQSKNAHLNIEAIDNEHLRAKFYVDNKIVQEKLVVGRLVDNYFEFHTNRLKFRFLINVYEQQTNRLALSKEGDLYLDTNRGGAGFFIIIPIPLSGTSFDTYNLKFKRIK